jgi:hypothetical protein
MAGYPLKLGHTASVHIISILSFTNTPPTLRHNLWAADASADTPLMNKYVFLSVWGGPESLGIFVSSP